MEQKIRKSQVRSLNLKSELYQIINSETFNEVDNFIMVNKLYLRNNFDNILPQLLLNIDSGKFQYNTIHALTLLIQENPTKSPFYERIFSKLINLIVSIPDINLKELAMNCLFRLILSMNNLSHSLLVEFLSYSAILYDDTDLTLGLRSIYLQCLGSAIIISEGPIISSTLKELSIQALSFFNKEKIELREAAYVYFYLVIGKFPNESEKYADQLIEEILNTFKNNIDDFECDNEDANDCDIDLDDERIECLPIFINEKSAALQLICSMSKVYPRKLIERLTHIEMVLDYSFKLENFEMSEQCVDTSYKLLKMLQIHSNDDFKQLWYNQIIHSYTQMIAKDESKETVGKILKYFKKLLKIVGKSLIPQVYIGVIIKQIVSLLQDSAACQQNTEENPEILLDNLTELVLAMVKIWKIEFSTRIQDIFYLYLQKSASTNNVEIVSIFIGEIGNLLSVFPELAYLHFETLFNRIEAIFQAEEDLLYRNSVFTLGVLFEVTGNKFLKYPRMLKIISWLLDNDDTPGIVDNGVVALCRAILASPSSVPEHYFFIILKNLPLKEDFEENKTVFKFLSYILLNVQGFLETDKVLIMIIDGIVDNFKDSSNYPIEKENLESVKKFINEKIQSEILERVLHSIREDKIRIFKSILGNVNF